MKNFNFVKKLLFIFILMFGFCGQLTTLSEQNDNLNYGDPYSDIDKNKHKKPKHPIVPEVSTFIVPFLLFTLVILRALKKSKQIN